MSEPSEQQACAWAVAVLDLWDEDGDLRVDFGDDVGAFETWAYAISAELILSVFID